MNFPRKLDLIYKTYKIDIWKVKEYKIKKLSLKNTFLKKGTV